jgi:hypothetical protein
MDCALTERVIQIVDKPVRRKVHLTANSEAIRFETKQDSQTDVTSSGLSAITSFSPGSSTRMLQRGRASDVEISPKP